MPFIFDVPQQTQIEVLFNQGQSQAAMPGAFSPMYDYVNNVLLSGSPPPTADLEVKKSQLWFSGATQANSGLGPYAIVIREYTQNQQRLHLGRPAPGGTGVGGLQEASNRVATGVFNDTKLGNLQEIPPRLPWTLLRVDQIARNDATAVGEVLFNIPGSSAASPQNAAWAGSVLHPLLGDDQSWRLISAPLQGSGIPAETIANTFDDWRNLLFAQASYYRALRSSFADVGYDLVAAPQLG